MAALNEENSDIRKMSDETAEYDCPSARVFPRYFTSAPTEMNGRNLHASPMFAWISDGEKDPAACPDAFIISYS